jgi:hypothetical protein
VPRQQELNKKICWDFVRAICNTSVWLQTGQYLALAAQIPAKQKKRLSSPIGCFVVFVWLLSSFWWALGVFFISFCEEHDRQAGFRGLRRRA